MPKKKTDLASLPMPALPMPAEAKSGAESKVIEKILLDHGAHNAQSIADWLYKIATDETVTTQFVTGRGQVVTVPVSVLVRVQAAKLWKEMTIDKAVADCKQQENKDTGRVLDLKVALMELSREMAEKRAAKKAGKVITVKSEPVKQISTEVPL